VIVADNTTVRLDMLNEPQPDLLMMRDGGQARMDADGYISGAPEFIAEIAASSALLWWFLQNDEFVEIEPDDHGILNSAGFPGLAIGCAALVSGDLAAALSRLS
jgi:hypothetical protein